MAEQPGVQAMHSPNWLLAGFDADRDQFHFGRVSRQTYFQSAFLDHRIQPMPTRMASLSGDDVDEVLAELKPEPACWILHTAFCASTLLANCLDNPGQTLVLKEPMVLSRLAQWHRQRPDEKTATQVGARIAGLLGRSYPGERVIIKPSNFANRCMPLLLRADSSALPTSPVVLMSNSLEELLVSILKKREEAERLMPGFLSSLLQDTDYAARVGLEDVAGLPLLKQGLLFWHCQRYALQQFRASWPGDVIGLTLASFFDAPADTVRGISAAWELGFCDSQIDEVVQQRVMGSHSKDSGQVYDPTRYREDSRRIAREYRSEIDAALNWGRKHLEALPPEILYSGEEPLGRII